MYFSQMLQQCQKLHTFGIQGCDGPLDEILQVLTSQADTLKNLKVQIKDLDNHIILLSTIPALINLEKLDVSRSKFVTDEFLDLIGKNCKKLKYLTLYGEHRLLYYILLFTQFCITICLFRFSTN